MIKITKRQAKTLTSSLRKAVEALPGIAMSHSGAQEILAKTFGFKNWSAFEAALIPEEKETTLAVAVNTALKPKYPLVNRGQFDFKDGCYVLAGASLSVLTGTLEDIRNCTAEVYGAKRLSTGLLDIEYGGETEVNWDEQRTACDDSGFRLWVDQDGHILSEAQCVLAPEDCSIDPGDREFAEPVRGKLVEALLECLKEQELLVTAEAELASSEELDSTALTHAEATIGFGTTYPERAALLKALKSL